MGLATGIAESGLRVAELTLDVSAANVANTLTDGYTPRRVEASELPGGGAEGEVVKEPDPLAEVRADRALLAPSGVDLVQETVNQIRGAAVYRANLVSLRTASELEQAAVDRLKE
jgi:hypothetical protein